MLGPVDRLVRERQRAEALGKLAAVVAQTEAAQEKQWVNGEVAFEQGTLSVMQTAEGCVIETEGVDFGTSIYLDLNRGQLEALTALLLSIVHSRGGFSGSNTG